MAQVGLNYTPPRQGTSPLGGTGKGLESRVIKNLMYNQFLGNDTQRMMAARKEQLDKRLGLGNGEDAQQGFNQGEAVAGQEGTENKPIDVCYPNSSHILEIRLYANNQMDVLFAGSGGIGSAASHYHYWDIPPSIFYQLKYAAQSGGGIGERFWDLVLIRGTPSRTRYPYSRVS